MKSLYRADIQRGLIAVATAVLVAAFVIGLPRLFDFLAVPEDWVADLRIATLTPPEPQHPGIVLVEITEDTLALLPYRSPVDRGFLAGVLTKLANAKVRAVGIDLLFDRTTQAEKDEALKRLIATYPVPLIAAWASVRDGLTDAQSAYLNDFLPPADRGHVKLLKGYDNTVRTIYPGGEYGGVWVPGFVAAIVGRLHLPAPKEVVPIVWRGLPADDKEPFAAYPAHVVPLLPDQWFAGKIVLIGANLPHNDRHRTPYAAIQDPLRGEMQGVAIHAQALAQLLEGRQPNTASLTFAVILTLALTALGVGLSLFDTPVSIKIGALMAVVLALWVGGFALFQRGGPLIPLIGPSLGLGVAYGIGSAFTSHVLNRQERYIRAAFSRYLSPALVDRLAAEGRMPTQGGEIREITVWISDLESYSSYSELLPPTELVALLNRVYTVMGDAVEEHGGFVAQFVGDAMVAAFNVPLDDADHASHAVHAAIACQARVEALNDEVSLPPGLRLHNRIGISTGQMLVGNIGSPRRLSYSIVGDDINLSSRLEGVNKIYRSSILVNGITVALCGDDLRFREVDVVRVKGRDTPVRIFEPLGGYGGTDAYDAEHLAAFAGAIEMFRDRRFEAAAAAFEALAGIDPVARAYAGRAREMAADPPPEDWDGINNLLTK